MFNDLLISSATLIILVELHRKLRQIWLRHLLSQKKAKRPRKHAVLHPKCERDCRFCQEDKRKKQAPDPEMPISWQVRKGKGGPKKKVATEGYFCPNANCEYYGITNEQTHALVGYGRRGLHEEIRDLKSRRVGRSSRRGGRINSQTRLLGAFVSYPLRINAGPFVDLFGEIDAGLDNDAAGQGRNTSIIGSFHSCFYKIQVLLDRAGLR